MTKRTRATRQQAARRRTPPRPGTPGAAAPGAPTGGIGRTAPPDDTEAALNGDASAEETVGAVATPTPTPSAAPPSGPTARRVGRVNPASAAASRARLQSKQQPSFAPLDPEDPAIPFDRVPYVPGDLRRVGIMAGLMVLLIIIAAVVVTHTVG